MLSNPEIALSVSRRPKKLDEQQRQLVTRLYREGTPIPEILKTVKISKSTLYGYMREETSSL